MNTDSNSNSNSSSPTVRTITLTGRPPVRVDDADWPMLAVGSWDRHDGQVAYQANRKWRLWVRVREHADGRRIVYAKYTFDSHFRHETDIDIAVGRLVGKDDDLIAAIERVGDDLRERDLGEGEAHLRAVLDEVIADLPAEEL